MIKQEPWWDLDTAEQSRHFDAFLEESATVYQRPTKVWSPRGPVFGYSEAEWEAFQWGWNAALKHYGIKP